PHGVYNRALGARYYGWPNEALRCVVRRGIDGLPARIGPKLSQTFLTRPPDIESLYLDNFAVFSRRMQQGLLTPEAVERAGVIDPHAAARRYPAETDPPTTLHPPPYPVPKH